MTRTSQARERLLALYDAGASAAELSSAQADYDEAATAEGVRAVTDRFGAMPDEVRSRLAVLLAPAPRPRRRKKARARGSGHDDGRGLSRPNPGPRPSLQTQPPPRRRREQRRDRLIVSQRRSSRSEEDPEHVTDYQVMPPLSAEEYDALRTDIAERGVLVPVVRDQHGNLLDGHHRAQIAEELGIDYRVDTVTVDDDQAARSLARSYNMARRHLSRAQRRAMIAEEITADPGRSDRQIGRQLGVDHKTVGSVRRELSGELPQPPVVPGTERWDESIDKMVALDADRERAFRALLPYLGRLEWCSDAEEAGIEINDILRTVAAWDLAADEGLVPYSRDLRPGQDVDLPTDRSWSEFYA